MILPGTEAGVDCDNGIKCRMGGVLGLCQVWGRSCMSDDDCRHGVCQKDGRTLCSATTDCPQFDFAFCRKHSKAAAILFNRLDNRDSCLQRESLC